MPPVAPVTSTVSPAWRPPSTTRFTQDVRPASGMAAPSISERLSGTGMSCPAGMAARVAWAPPPTRAMTRVPGSQGLPFSDSSTTPEHSRPGTRLSPGGGGYCPRS